MSIWLKTEFDTIINLSNIERIRINCSGKIVADAGEAVYPIKQCNSKEEEKEFISKLFDTLTGVVNGK